jgi:ribosomal protein S12 methylthiotransferase accessory factor
MLVDGERFGEVAGTRKAAASFVEFLERKLGITAVYDRRRVAFGRIDLIEPLELASALLDRGVIDSFGPSGDLPDEPRLRIWSCRLHDRPQSSGTGASADDDKAALEAALAESLERYIWWTERDYFLRPVRGTPRKIGSRSPIIPPERFVSFSRQQREASPELRLSPDASYLWIQGISLVTGKKTYVPAQTVSAAHDPSTAAPHEPLIRMQTTNGLATWPTRTGALLAGALECIEREAFMVLWFNQLTLPRAELSSLRERSASLDALLSRCERYRLQVHIVRMLTDAPTHAVLAVVEDKSGIGSPYAFGLKADRSFVRAAEKALVEALRARRFSRYEDAAKKYDGTKKVDDIGHSERVFYWQKPEHAEHLAFLVRGEEKNIEDAAWEHDTPEQHLVRIVNWCKQKKFECVSVALGTSKANPTRWHIEMLIMPDLQPVHLTEKMRHLGGERWKSIPEQFGYKPLKEPFVERPHPFS